MNSHGLSSSITLPEGPALQDLLSCVKDWALSNAAAMRSKQQYSSDSVVFAPFTLLPSPFPRIEFEKAVKIQPILNELIHTVAHDHEFLKNTLKNTVEVDEFTQKLFDIYEKVYEEGFAQYYCLGLFRSDYMVDDDKEQVKIKQVELNTIASSLAGLASQFSLLHRFVLERLQRFDEIKMLPENTALNGLCSGLVEGWKIYNNPKAAILVVVEDVSYNICDQRAHDFEIYKINPKITIIRRTLTELSERGHLDPQRKFFIDGNEVAVVYYRSGYSPDQYYGDKEWDARLQLERSTALKCPTIHYHLAGTKKVQQVLATENMLSRFISDAEKVKMVQDIFTGLYSLDMDSEGDKAVRMAMHNPEAYVLKPQREGGGNNIYGDDILKVLSGIGHSKERTAYILMSLIQPTVFKNYIIRPGVTEGCLAAQDVVSELGIYGIIIGKKDKILVNKQTGHMLRTKSHLAREGGVAAGVGALDSPFFY